MLLNSTSTVLPKAHSAMIVTWVNNLFAIMAAPRQGEWLSRTTPFPPSRTFSDPDLIDEAIWVEFKNIAVVVGEGSINHKHVFTRVFVLSD